MTHHPRPSLEMEVGTVFHFVEGSPQAALDNACEDANGLDVRFGGGPTILRDFVAEDLIDTMHLVLVPVVLGHGVRLWDGLEGIEQRYDLETVNSPSGITHLSITRRTWDPPRPCSCAA